jgi:flagellar motor protein MotB
MAEGRGAANPVGDNGTAQGRALNRRVELFLYAVK